MGRSLSSVDINLGSISEAVNRLINVGATELARERMELELEGLSNGERTKKDPLVAFQYGQVAYGKGVPFEEHKRLGNIDRESWQKGWLDGAREMAAIFKSAKKLIEKSPDFADQCDTASVIIKGRMEGLGATLGQGGQLDHYAETSRNMLVIKDLFLKLNQPNHETTREGQAAQVA